MQPAIPAPAFSGLRALADCGGCAAKAPPELVAQLLSATAASAGTLSQVLVGLTPADDAAVYAIDSTRALVASVDFFPPIVDDPGDYGTVAAANAVSDVYAMGGTVAFALAVCGFPAIVPQRIIVEVNRAAAAVIASCGGGVIGGHSIRCQTPLFGLCVLGFVQPQQIWRKAGARPGDALMLSKAIGTGILLSSRCRDAEREAVASMRTTNLAAAAALHAAARAPHAVTDVSGYGLLGHAGEMAMQSGMRLRIDSARLPLLAGAARAARSGVRTSAHQRDGIAGDAAALEYAHDVSVTMRALLQDPQTSGGLLAAVDPGIVPQLEASGFTRIGEVLSGPAGVTVR